MGRKKKYSSEWDVHLKEMYEGGMSLHEIYKEYGIHPMTTRDRLINQGVTIRDADEAREQFKQKRSADVKKGRSKRTGNDTAKRNKA